MDSANRRRAVRGLKAAAILGDEKLFSRAERCLEKNHTTLAPVSSAAEARRVLGERYVDLWLVDFDLPGDGALSLIREIRVRSRAGILVTGVFDAARAVRFQRFDAIILLTPFTEHQLLDAVVTALRLVLPRSGPRTQSAAHLNASSSYHELAVASAFKASRLAELLHTSPRRLHRHFRDRFALGPQRWLSEYRLALSLKRLRLDPSIKLTAYNLAFLHASNFAREFKKAFGTSPVWVARGGDLPGRTVERAELRLRQALCHFDRTPGLRDVSSLDHPSSRLEAAGCRGGSTTERSKSSVVLRETPALGHVGSAF